MNKQKWLLLIAIIALIGGAAGLLSWLQTHQKLGSPGIKATPVPGSIVMRIGFPERVLDFTSTNVPQSQTVVDFLPKDTSYAQRRYIAPDGFWVNANLILMGMDRTSIHKPEFCLPGQGWRIESKSLVDIPISGPAPYTMQVAKWFLSNTVQTESGEKKRVRGIYVFWFVADNEQTVSHGERMWWLARDLMRTGVLQRWAYVSYFTICMPEQGDQVFDRVKQFIAASVPEFQLPPKTAVAASVAK